MTKDEIAKLPTPETDAAQKRSFSYDHIRASLACSLEQRLAAAVMALEPLCMSASHGDGLLIPSIAQAKQARETLAAIRGDE